MSQVIVIGGQHHNTLGVIRSLGRNGIKPIVILTSKKKDTYISRSKYISEFIQLDDSNKVVPYLLNYGKEVGSKRVIITCHDKISATLDEYMDELTEWFFVPGTSDKRLLKLANKDEMSQLAIEVGLNVPFSITNLSEFSLGIDKFPVITKPLASKDGSKRDIVVCNTPEELTNFFDSRKGRKFQVQQFIDKLFEFQLIGCSIDGGKEVIIPGVSKLIRMGLGSNTGFLEYTYLTSDYDEVVNKTKDFISATGYSGLFSVEFIRGKDGKDYFLEMNFRNDGNAICTTNAGANLPYFWVQRCLRKEVEIPRITHNEFVMPEYNELTFWCSGAVSTIDFLKDLFKSTSYMEYAADDPGPTHGYRDFIIKLLMVMIKRPVISIAKLFGLK